MNRLSVLAAILFCGAGGSADQSQKEPTLVEVFQKQWDVLSPGIGNEQIPARAGPQQKLQELCFRLGAPGRQADRAAACKILAEGLGKPQPPAARVWILTQLELLGGEECAQAVAALLEAPEEPVRDAARRALERNPAAAANAELLAGLARATGTWRMALANSLANRRSPESVPALAALLADSDPAVSESAANGLGMIGTPEAAKALANALARASGTKAAIADAYLRCADKRMQEGKTGEAAAMYHALADPPNPRSIRLAALEGALRSAGDDAQAMVFRLLAGEDRDESSIAAGNLERILGKDIARTAEQQFDRLPPRGRALLLGALAARGSGSSMALAMKAAHSDNELVREAGLRALGRLGDASAISVLIPALASAGSQRDAAREALQVITAPKADRVILDAMQGSQRHVRATLIEILEARRATPAVSMLIHEAESEDPGVRNVAIRALGNIAEPRHVSQMLKLLLKTAGGRDREDLERAIVAVCRRTAEAERQAEPVLQLLPLADDEARCMMLVLVGRIGGPNARDAVQQAMSCRKPEVREAAIRALCNWPDATVIEDLRRLAENAEDRTHRIWALRAFIRVMALPSNRSPQQSLEMFQQAMKLATREEEQQLVLSRVEAIRCVEALRWILPHLDQPALRSSACRAVVDLAHHRDLRTKHKSDFEAALKRVVRESEDTHLVERAEQYLGDL